ncbi:hypothetical protein [Enterococcus faecalis]|uniref:hypothetical protein n=1 Tax=Enterococcus faecalis TaxID=1351 RepID=UPI001A956D91|nr:hypothetical protein [Enterococcus faecalis]MBO1138038.1 hypothetical protein [Enterococcus faecalis]
MFSLLLKRATYRFELDVSETIQKQSIQSTPSLINYVIGVNNALIQREEVGWLIIKKYKQTKKGDQLLMAKKIELPLYEDNPYFDELLMPFYTKKPLVFEPVEEVTEEKEEVVKTNQVIPEMPEEMKALLARNQPIAESKAEEKSVEEREEVEVEEPPVEANKEEIEKLHAQLLQKEQEVQRLKQEKEYVQEEKQAVSIKEQATPLVEPKSSTLIEKPLVSTEPVVSSISSQLTTQSVPELLATLSQEMREKLEILLQEERRVMEEEIRQLDKRSEIRPNVQKQIEQERSVALQVEEQRLTAEKQALCQAEQERHEKRLAEIEAQVEAEKQQRFSEIKQHLEEKETQLIAQTYAQQTAALERMLQERKDALSLRQQEVNEGLNQQVTQILATFNTKYNEVIAQLEAQKQRSAPVILEKQIS